MFLLSNTKKLFFYFSWNKDWSIRWETLLINFMLGNYIDC